MPCLDDPEKRLLNAILRGAAVWSAPTDLAAELGWNLDETTDRLADLDASGWIEVWERSSDVVVTLSTLGAERLRVRLVEHGRNLTPRWLSLDEPEPPAPRASGVFVNARAMELEFVIDSALRPDEQVELDDEAARFAMRSGRRTSKDDAPRPTRFLGQSLTPWPGPAEFEKPPCPSCGGRALAPVEYCLGCDRWGLDSSTARPRPLPSAEVVRARSLLEDKARRELRKIRLRRRIKDREAARRAGSRKRD